MGEEFARVAQADFSAYERVIAVSDIHGDCAGFDGMLESVGFGPKDALVIVGDILERGRESLPLLKRVVSLAKNGRVYMVLGNNDMWLARWCRGAIDDERILRYLHAPKKSVLREMARELAMPYETLSDVAALREACCERYNTELAYLESLPHIIDSKLATFVHAGVRPGDLQRQDPSFCMKADAFAQMGYHFDKPVIVGHWPASNYRTEKIEANVYFNQEANIYSIDGGNSMKSWQQINVLTLTHDGAIVCSAYDRLKKVRVLDRQKNEGEALSLVFPNTRLEVREDMGDKKKCFVPYLGRDMLFDSKKIYEYGHNTYCSDFTTYCLPVERGEIVSYCGEYEDGILIKRDGVVGKYCGAYEFI